MPYGRFELRGGADSVRTLLCSVAGDHSDHLVCARKVDRPNAVILGIGDVERAAGPRRCTAWPVEPCCRAVTDGMLAARIGCYNCADSCRIYVDSSNVIAAYVSNVERSTALRDRKWK